MDSHQRAFADVNFSTIVMSMTLFGRRTEPPADLVPEQLQGIQFPTTKTRDAAFQSLYLSLVTGLCEETVFRRQVAAMLTQITGGNVISALFQQAILFGLGHINPGSPPAENAIVVGLQIINGLGFGLIYILSGGDLVPCIIAHTLYDFVTFFKTWLDANGQIEYAEAMYSEPLPPDVEREVQRVIQSARPAKMDPRVYKVIKRLFYTFDFDKNKSLSLSEVRKGIAYMALEKRAGKPPPQEQVDALFRYAIQNREPSTVSETNRDRLSFADFLRLYVAMIQRKPIAIQS